MAKIIEDLKLISEINNLTKRQVNFIFNKLLKSNNYIENKNESDIKKRKEIIINLIKEKHLDEESKINELKQINLLCNNYLLPDSEFKWLSKDNPRLFKTVVCYLIKFNNAPQVYSFDYESCLSAITNYFDSVEQESDNPRPLGLQQEELKKIKYDWGIISSRINNIKWLHEKNEEQCEWAWDYLLKNNGALNFLNSNSSMSRYCAIQISIDLCFPSEDSRTLLLIRMNKAWNQKKQRDNINGKKAYNFVLNIDTKEKLDKLAQYKGMKKNETIEWLINSECNRTS